MNTIAVFGATGRTGIILTKKLIDKGYKVKALVLDSNELFDLKDKIEFIEGSIEDSDKVAEIIKGCDAVVSVVGYIKGSKKGMQTRGLKNIIEAMKENNIRRIISLTGSGVSDPKDKTNIILKFLNSSVKFFAKNRFEDGVNHVNEIKNNDLDYTIVRANLLTNETPKGGFIASYLGDKKLGFQVSRENVANFIIECLEKNIWIKEMPVVTDAIT